MSCLPTGNRTASIEQRLLNKAKAQKVDVNILRIRFALERFLYRLGQTEHRNRFTLKGAILFALWSDQVYRTTKDADFLLRGQLDEERIVQAIGEICNAPVQEDDAIQFLAKTVRVQPIKQDQQYEGLRVLLTAVLGKVEIPLQLDIGTGDALTPGPIETLFSVIIDELPAPNIRVYSRENVIAEKLEAMVNLDLANSRLKDFYDVWIIVTQLGFDPDLLVEAISVTFERRRTTFPEVEFRPLTPYFWSDPGKQIQWRAFLRRARVRLGDVSLQDVCEDIAGALAQVFASVRHKDEPSSML